MKSRGRIPRGIARRYRKAKPGNKKGEQKFYKKNYKIIFAKSHADGRL